MYSVANRLARQGRGGDDTLVHMNRGEVAGLNAINHLVNNRPLSTNPTTGLPEAMDLTDILIGLGIGAAAMVTGGAAAAAYGPVAGILAGAGTGAALNTGKAAIKGDQDLGQAAAFGGLSGAISGAGAAFGGGAEGAGAGAATNTGTQAAEKSIEEAAKQTLEESAKQGLSETGKEALQASAPSGIAGLSNAPGAASNMTSQAQNAITPSSLQSLSAPTTDVTNATNTGIQSQLGAITPAGAASPTPPGPWEQSFANLQNTVMNPGQHQTLLAAQVGAAGLEDQYKQQGLNEQANAKQAAAIVKQYRDAGIMPSELPKQLTDMANQYKGMAAGGTVRDVEGLRAIPTGFVNQQPMTNFYPQSMIPQAQPLQSTQPIRHEVIGYADGGAVGYGYAEGGDVGGGDEGLLHGPGTGQSDGIMGLIDGEQGQELVRLAESEFVIPADVVSALGDGSTKAGAKALYDMINRIRMQAHGHIKQSNPVNPAEVLPA